MKVGDVIRLTLNSRHKYSGEIAVVKARGLYGDVDRVRLHMYRFGKWRGTYEMTLYPGEYETLENPWEDHTT